MKKIFLLSAVALMTLAACDDYEDQFNLDSQINDVKKGTAIVLTDADYANIAGLAANKTLAAKLDAESGTNAYTEALAKLPSQKYFNTLITPDQFDTLTAPMRAAGINFALPPEGVNDERPRA